MHIIPKLRGGQRRRFRRRYQRERNALVKTRLLVILRLNDGESSVAIERGGICVRSTVSHVRNAIARWENSDWKTVVGSMGNRRSPKTLWFIWRD